MTPQTLAPYVLRALVRHQMQGRLVTLQTLVEDIGVRKTDLRRTVTVLHEQGFVDALRMRTTLQGFAIGRALLKKTLPPLRRPVRAQEAAA